MNRIKLQQLATSRKNRIRAKLTQNSTRPRLTIFRSNKYTYLQVVDNVTRQTVAAADSRSFEKDTKATLTKTEAAQKAAEALLKELQEKKITAVTLDRGGYKYHGRIKAIAEVLRAGKVQV
jgi:large subunit ribosomal protein L18